MTPSEIAEDRGLSVEAVKTTLMSVSSKYRKLCKIEADDESELNFSKEQQKVFARIIYETATTSEDEVLRFKAACYGRDDAKGRKDIVKQVSGFSFNVLAIDERMKKAIAAMSGSQKLIHNV